MTTAYGGTADQPRRAGSRPPPFYNPQRSIVRATAVSSSPRIHVPHRISPHMFPITCRESIFQEAPVRCTPDITRRVSRYTIQYRIVTHHPVESWVVLFYDRRGVLSNS